LYGQYYKISPEWIDLLSLGRDFQFAPAESTSYSIMVDDKNWVTLNGNMGFAERHWPGIENQPRPVVTQIFPSPEEETNRASRFSDHLYRMKITPSPMRVANADGSIKLAPSLLSNLLNQDAVNKMARIAEHDTESDFYEPEIEHN